MNGLEDLYLAAKMVLLYGFIAPVSGARAVEQMIFDTTGRKIVVFPRRTYPTNTFFVNRLKPLVDNR